MTSFKVKSIVAVAALAAAASASAGEILIVSGLSGSSEISTTTEVLDNLKSLHTAVGNNVTVSDLLPADLSGFKQVWDIRFDQALNAAAQSEYTSFLQAGGGLFLMGENAGFMSRNDSILSLISSLGGGTIGFTTCDSYQVVNAPFNGPNAVSAVGFLAPGCFDSNGTGQWISSTPSGGNILGSGIAFGVGSLSNAMTGALTSILDVNFMQGVYDQPASQNLTKNLIGFVGGQVDPVNPVPEPGTLMLAGLAAVGALASRRKAA